ncbi:MAG: hypothetical protein JSU01_00915 [Bacteroidetes bacterium]|nr:hypothetical protein [Bacteroidota bacterium]
MLRVYMRLAVLVLLLAVFITSCQKDENVTAAKTDTQLKVDSAEKQNTVPGNYLAATGILKIKFKDSTYTFDASQDSIAFVNISIDGKEYYGITAINKAHSVSFGISTLGAPIAEMPGSVAGCQFLLNSGGKTNTTFTLTRNVLSDDYGTFSLEKYNQDTILAKGTFHTYLATDAKKNPAFTLVDGSFELKVK